MAEDLEQELKALATQVAQFYKQGDREQALARAQAAYALTQQLPDANAVAVAMNTLGACYRALRLYEQALPLLHQVLVRRYPVLGLTDPLVAESIHTLGELHQESLMAVDSIIRGYILARTGDAHAADEVTQDTRLSLCGYILAQTGNANTAGEGTQEILDSLLRAGFAKYDPAKGRLITYAKGCAHLMLLRYYSDQQHRSRVTKLLSEFHTGYPDFSEEGDTRDVLARLPDVPTPSPETAALATEERHLWEQALEELYQIIFASGLCPPHQGIALGFRTMWRTQGDEEAGASPGKESAVMWPPRRMVAELSDTPLTTLRTQLEDELVKTSELPAARVRTHLGDLREHLAHGMHQLVHAMLPPQRAPNPATAAPMYTLRPWMCAFAAKALHRQVAQEISQAAYADLLQALRAWIVRETMWRHYYTSPRPADDIGYWCEDVQRRVWREIRRRRKGPLFLQLQQARERRGRR